MDSQQIITRLKSMENSDNVAGMARFGISSKNTFGVSVRNLRILAKGIKRECDDKKELHDTAIKLWNSQIHEARMLATIVEQPDLVSEDQADSWVKDIDSWDICDGFCLNLIDKTSFAFEKIEEWVRSDSEFVRRAAFSLLAGLAVHRKDASDSDFEKFFPIIKKYSTDERNFVRKSVNWSLRQVGKRNKTLLPKAIDLAEEIETLDSKTARWVAKDALKELRGHQ